MEKKFSIIIPVYNGEKHIKKCIDDVLTQEYENYEIIIINDGSKDNTSKILKEYVLNKRINIVEKENTGVSDSRNIGIEMATGEYIVFLDSDDKLRKDSLKKLNERLCQNNYDIILFGFEVRGSNSRKNDTSILRKIKGNTTIKEEIIKKLLANKNNVFGYVWRAVYSKKMLDANNIRFYKII